MYCLLRLFKAGVAVFWAVPSPSGSGQGAVDGGMSGGEGPDPATRLVRFALNRHLLVDEGDAEGWSEVLYGFGFGFLSTSVSLGLTRVRVSLIVIGYANRLANIKTSDLRRDENGKTFSCRRVLV